MSTRTARTSPLTARERRDAALKTRRRRHGILTVGVLAVVAFMITVAIVVQSKRAADERPLVAPAGATGEEKLLVTVGRADAPAVLTVYEDPRCPGCAHIERLLHDTINRLQDEGKLRVDYHLLSFVDRIAPGRGSKYAANALAAAQDAGKFREYHDVLYAHPPKAENVDTYGDKKVLLDLARKVPGLSTASFTAAVKDGTHDTWIAAIQKAFDRQTLIQGTPALVFKGRDLLKDPEHALTPERLTELVDNEATPPQAPSRAGAAPDEG
ncbi:DsbA family protein [Streptomyces sp. NPDC085665]|uniref:DsbA family protein n=1 Tax=Streptomyces sp. NPDC085665 TaxID=3365735 RepID=UPI0037CDEF68